MGRQKRLFEKMDQERECLEIIRQHVQTEPNDQKLGEKIRKYLNQVCK